MSVNVLQLKVSLQRIEPPIWRRLEVKDNISFYELHHVIQIAMGWWNAHLFEFSIDNYKIGITDGDMVAEGTLESKEVKLSRLIDTEKKKFRYLYDFGDNWEHEIEVEKISPMVNGKSYPSCTGGERNCPPEDILGFPGYMNLLNVMKDKNNPEYHGMLEWLGEEFDPEYFDLKETNGELQFIIKTKNWDPN
ncbi:MAG: plasmid pRiA4b ORF-3 family protein [Bacteroidetes bacterium]|nr:MAG: plasmid pRiA4b ORF-3 family protein [Bacteroidota bacterium]